MVRISGLSCFIIMMGYSTCPLIDSSEESSIKILIKELQILLRRVYVKKNLRNFCQCYSSTPTQPSPQSPKEINLMYPMRLGEAVDLPTVANLVVDLRRVMSGMSQSRLWRYGWIRHRERQNDCYN